MKRLITSVFSYNRMVSLMKRNEEMDLAGYNITKSVRIDEEMVNRLQKIGLYEKCKDATLMRMWIQDKILTYYRNPKFKQWLKRLGLIPLKEKS